MYRNKRIIAAQRKYLRQFGIPPDLKQVLTDEYQTEQYDKVERNRVVPWLHGAGMTQNDSNYCFEYTLGSH